MTEIFSHLTIVLLSNMNDPIRVFVNIDNDYSVCWASFVKFSDKIIQHSVLFDRDLCIICQALKPSSSLKHLAKQAYRFCC